MNWVEKTQRMMGELGMTRTRIGPRIGYSGKSRTFSGALSEGSTPTADKGCALARELRVSPHWLFDDEQDWPAVPEQSAQDATIIEALTAQLGQVRHQLAETETELRGFRRGRSQGQSSDGLESPRGAPAQAPAGKGQKTAGAG